MPDQQLDIVINTISIASILTIPAVLVFGPYRLSERLTTILHGIDDPAFIGPVLFMYLHTEEGTARRRLSIVLQDLLSRMRASHAELLTSEHKNYMVRVLTHRASSDRLRLAILKGLKQVGDEKALPTVQKVAHGFTAIWGREVRRAAAECSEYLQARADEAQHGQTLLRASTIMADTPNTLLRAATPAPDTTAQSELLRPQV